ncbi:BTB/POZ domain-containing protein DOT3 isoform X2 [Vitis vinifera]|uniref:BTB/POZ domain-containing protein DOT3 isoform X2 n=1 Tax=Vitis vinifera TaxID=29760 RepID=UPI002882EBC1|nr:BTB/POZ domain-containing protein DOT3 isoform X2 [Vitis vinifera]
MKKSLTLGRPLSPGSESDYNDQVHDQSIVVPSKLVTIADSFEKKEHSWFVTSQVPTDLTIQVQDITFYAHKYPLVSRCGYISQIELQPSISNLGYDLKLENFPGGSETFEIILKFCYGLPVDLNPNNAASLRCASEFLEMTEELDEGNLISKTEAFLTFVVLSSWRDSITVLKSCENLSPWAENLQIIRRCCDSIAWKASQDNSTTGETISEEGWWFDDVATLRIDHFTRIMTAARAKGLKPEIIGSCIMHYAEKWLPGMDVALEGPRAFGYGKNELQLSILSGRRQEGGVGHNKELKMIIESLVSILPPEKEAVSCKFLLWMLKMSVVYSATQVLVSELEKRVGMVLQDANVNDLLIPTYRNGDQGKLVNSSEELTMHDIDAVQRIVEYFLMHEQQQPHQHKSSKLNVSKLLDNYLAEIARDPNLSITKFHVLAETLPENARTCHDGLYRAIDTYLKVLLAEQVKMRVAMKGKEPVASGKDSEQEESQPSAQMEIKTLKVELEKMKMNMAELQRDHSELQRECEKLNNKQRSIPSWTLGWKKIKNSTLFSGKVDGNESGDGMQRPNPVNGRMSDRRRLSVA